MDKSKPAKSPAPSRPAGISVPSEVATTQVSTAPLYRPIDWITFGITTTLAFMGYFLTLAPDLTLEDSGELAVGSFYAGVPHPPGYPLWTLYTWLFTVLIPVSNIAFRVALGSAVAAALSCGLLGLLVSRGSSMIIESIADLKNLERRSENAICMVSGFVAGMLLAFNGFFWSQAIIVEVYCLGVLSLMGVLCFLLRWVYAPNQRRYLYLAFFMFGLCFTNHQTLIVAAMGIEIAVMLVNPALGRDLFFANSVVYFLGLVAKANHSLTSFDGNLPLFIIYNAVGLGSVSVCLWLIWRTRRLMTEWKSLLIMGGVWMLGAAFYFYMPIASMTNPPMNWGYPRTVDGFFHALQRGQYDRTRPTNDIFVFFNQLRMYGEGAVEEFNLAYLLMGLIPWYFFRRMQKRERAWMLGLLASYVCLSILLLILLNPTTDRQSRDLTKVFFCASYVMVAMWIGYGLTLMAAYLTTYYRQWRPWVLYGGAAAAGLALFSLIKNMRDVNNPWVLYTAMFGVALVLAFIGLLLLVREKVPLKILLLLFTLMPTYTILSHWWDNEQRGHLFGFWFGHDMFCPDIKAPDGKRIYPDMDRDAILFGGTDPGRFCPTYMIFCESFILPSKRRDPNFDRRDVYIITQNALADGTYLNYIRAHYNRSTQIDPPFFQELFHTKLFAPLDDFFLNLGTKIEKRRREQGVYPPKEIYTPSPADSKETFDAYMTDFQRRMAANQLKPGEDFRVIGDKIQVSGQVSVMQINGLLTKIIFDKNPGHAFYVEESFPLDWMYPYLTPFGIIMKINREPVPEFTEEIMRKDHEFWSLYSQRMIGNWITYDTTIKEICDFAERIYQRGDFRGFMGDHAFVRDNDAQKAFSKLRSALGGVYFWRINAAKTEAERKRLMRECEFAFKQAFALCPFSPEALFRFVPLLAAMNRIEDAQLLAQTCLKFDPENKQVRELATNLESAKNSQADASRVQKQLAEHQKQMQSNPTNMQLVFNVISDYLQLQQTGAALAVLDQVLARPNADVSTLLTAAQVYAHVGQTAKLEQVLQRLAQLLPNNPEVWYDLAAAQAALNKNSEALNSLAQSMTLSAQRLAQQRDAKNLQQMVVQDERFKNLRSLPEFQKIIAPK